MVFAYKYVSRRRDMSHFIERVTRSSRICRMSTMSDSNPRPTKRQRTNSVSPAQTQASSLLSPPPESSQPSPTPALRPLPPAILLLALPGLLAHHPTHPDFGFSLFLSLRALRQCLALPALAPDLECRAWTNLAEVGMRVMESGFCTAEAGCDWAVGIDAEVRLSALLPVVHAEQSRNPQGRESTQQGPSHCSKSSSTPFSMF